MRLLVSVGDAAEACAAIAGGADVVDAKDPARGALGAVGPSRLRGIVGVVGGARPVSAALGDIGDVAAGSGTMDDDPAGDPGDERPHGIIAAALDACVAGAAFVKIGVADGTSAASAASDVARVRGAVGALPDGRRGCAIVLAAYADAPASTSDTILRIAEECGVWGVLLDTRIKQGGGLFSIWSAGQVQRWVDAAHHAGLAVAIAGSLAEVDFPTVRAMGADLVGVRRAACEGGRLGRVSEARVRALANATRGRD